MVAKKLLIKKINEDNFIISAENEASFNYAKEIVKRGDYILLMSFRDALHGDGYTITRERKGDMFIEVEIE